MLFLHVNHVNDSWYRIPLEGQTLDVLANLGMVLKIDSTYSPELKKNDHVCHLRGEVKIDVHLKISTNTFEVNGIFLVNT